MEEFVSNQINLLKKNMQIYFKYGFTNYIKTTIESYPAVDENSKAEDVIVSFYYKEI